MNSLKVLVVWEVSDAVVVETPSDGPRRIPVVLLGPTLHASVESAPKSRAFRRRHWTASLT